MAEDIAGLSIPIEASTALLRQQFEQAVQIVGSGTDRMDRQLSKGDKAFDRFAGGVKRAVGGVQKELDAAVLVVGNSADAINRRLGIVGQGANTKSRAADIEAWGRELDRLEGKFDPVTTAAKRYEAEVTDLQAAQRAGIVTGEAFERELVRIADAYDPATIAARKLREEAEKDAAAFRVLEDRLDRHGAAARKAAEEQAKLDKALAENRISYDRYTTLSRALQDTGAAAGVAAKGTKLAAHEITNLTYQLQDTVVSLAGGMNPFLVMMQQGPQATSAVGGVGRALSLLATPAGVATIAVAAVAGAVLLVTAASEQHQKSVMAVTTSTRLMGDAAGLSASALERMAERGAAAGSVTVTAAREQESAYLRTGKIGGETMERLIGLSRDYAAATEQDLTAAKSDLASLFTDPVAGAERLQAAYGILTAKEMEHVRQLKVTGHEEEARVIVADKLAGRVRGLADNTTTFAQAWERVGRAVSNAFDAVGKAAAPETNAAAIKRLEEERRRLIAARQLDRTRVDGETGGAASDDAVPIDSRYSAPGTGTAGGQRLTDVEAELRRRQTIEARAREQAAIRKDTRDRDQFGVEAAAITRAARPLGTQIDDVTEKVTKLRRAFGPGMEGASDDTKRALGGFENQLADLRAAEKEGVDLEAYKRKKLGEVDKQASGMVGPAREKFLAQQRQEIELIGTATTATERKAQIDAAGATVVNGQTAAIAQQNAQTTIAIQGSIASADAYRESLAAGIEADARRQAQSEAVTSAIDVEARTRQIVAERAGQEAVTLAQTTQQLELETEAQREVVAATDDGVAARMEAERAAQVAKVTSVALAAAQAAEKAGNVDLAKRLRDLAAGYDGVSKSAASLSKLDALKQYNQQQRDGLEQLQTEASLVGATADERTRALAIYQAEVQIRQKGIDVSKTLTDEERRTVEQTRQLAVNTADWKIATDHAQESWKGVGDAIDNAVVRPLESVVDQLVKGQGEALKLGDILKGSLASLGGDALKMGLINPAKNALGFEHSASLWDLPMFGGTGTQQQKTVRNADGSVSMAPAAQGVGGSWLSQPVFPEANAQQLFAEGQSGRWTNGQWDSGQGWIESFGKGSTNWGQVIAGVGGIAAGVATATAKGATTGQKIGGGLMGVGGMVAMIPGGQVVGGVMMAAGALLSAVTGAKDRGTAYSRSNITLGANGKYALGTFAADNDGNPTQFNADAAKVAKGLNDIAAKLNLTPRAGASFIDTKEKTAEQAALELLKGMQSAVPNVAYALAHETSVSLEDALQHLEFANSFDRQIEGLRSSISDLFAQFQSGVDAADTFGRSILDVIDNASTVFAVSAGASLPGFATGTLNAPSGYAVVGEEGPEVVRLAGGERIWNARESAQMIAGLGQGRDDTLIHLRSTDELATVRRALGMKGKVNPATGLLGFDDSGDGVGSDNSSGGERDTPGSGTSQGETGSGYGSDAESGGLGGFIDAVAEALDAVNQTISEALGIPAHETQALAGMVGLIGTATIGGVRAAAETLGGFLESTIGGDAPSEAGPGDPGGTAAGNTDPGVLEVFARLRDVIVGDPNGEDANALVGGSRVGVGLGGGATVQQIADAPWKLFEGSMDDPLGALSDLDTAAQQLLAATGQIPDVLQRALDGANAYAVQLGLTPATTTRQIEQEQAQQRADTLQTQFDGVGLARTRVAELNDVVTSLANGTFNPIGKDFDALATDMKRAAGAYTAAGQAVPEGLFAATRQMEALGAARKRLLDEVAGVVVETSPEQQKVEQIKGKWSTSATDLVKAFAAVGIAGDDLTAKLNEGLTNELKKEQGVYSKASDTALRQVRGESGYDTAVTAVDSYKTALSDINALWPEGADRARETGKAVDTLGLNLGALVKSGGITSKSLKELQAVYADQPVVLAAITAALNDLTAAAASQQAVTIRHATQSFDQAIDPSSYTAPTASSLLADAGVTDNLGAFTTDLDNFTTALARGSAGAADARYIFGALTRQLADGTITGDQYNTLVQGITQSWTDAQSRQATMDSYNADVAIRAATATGNDLWATTMRFDVDAARQRQSAWSAGVRGDELATLDRVLGVERADTIAKAKQQQLLTAYDQQIRGLQSSSQAARDFVSTFGQVVGSIRQAMKDWKIGDDAPLSPGEQKTTLEEQVAETFDKAMAGDADALAAIVPLLEKRNALEADQTKKTERVLWDDSMAKLASLDAKFGPQLDAAEKTVQIADAALKVAQEERDAVSRYGEKQIAVTQDLKDGVLAAFGDLTTAVNGIGGSGGGGSVVAPDKGGAAAEQVAAQSAWMAEWFGRYAQLVAGQNNGTLTPDQAYNTGASLWQEKVDRINALSTDPAVWRAVIASARQSPYGGPTADWITQVAHDKGIPTFATGGDHAGGLRIVGERGWELEATGASRIFTADQIATALAAARGELGPNVVGFLPSTMGGPSGIASLVRAMERVGEKIDGLRGELQAGNHEGVQQRAAVGGVIATGLDHLETALNDLPRRIAGQLS